MGLRDQAQPLNVERHSLAHDALARSLEAAAHHSDRAVMVVCGAHREVADDECMKLVVNPQSPGRRVFAWLPVGSNSNKTARYPSTALRRMAGLVFLLST